MSSTAVQRPARRGIRLAITGVAVVALVVAMIANTRFLTSEEAQAVTPADFDAEVYATEAFPGIVDAVSEDAYPLAEIVPAVTADPTVAGEQYGNVAGTDKYAIPVMMTGLVSAADANFLTVTVDGVPPEITVRVPVGQAVNGTAIRDVTGEIEFADFPGQTDYQQVANEFKTLVTTEIVGEAGVASLANTTITVTGVYVTNSGPADAFIVTPVSIEPGA